MSEYKLHAGSPHFAARMAGFSARNEAEAFWRVFNQLPSEEQAKVKKPFPPKPEEFEGQAYSESLKTRKIIDEGA